MRLSIPLSLLLLGSLAACHPARISYDYDLQADYAQYRTYEWASAPGNSITDRRIRASVEQALAARGLRRAEGTAGDISVSAYTIIQGQRTQSVGVGVGVGLRLLPGVSVGLGTHSSHSQVEPAARIQLEFRDVRSGQVIWKAEADNAFDPKDSPEDIEGDVRDAVGRMLDRFPPKGHPAR